MFYSFTGAQGTCTFYMIFEGTCGTITNRIVSHLLAWSGCFLATEAKISIRAQVSCEVNLFISQHAVENSTSKATSGQA